MDGNHHFFHNQKNIREFKREDNEAPTLEKTLRDLIANSNGNATNSISGENILTGGPPPAKPFPDSLPTNLSKPLNTEVYSRVLYKLYLVINSLF